MTTITNILLGEANLADLWYDWFCRESALENKSKKLVQKLRAIAGSKKFDNDKTTVCFKNNCPLNGSLYDDFRLVDMETRETIYTVVPSCGHKFSKGKAQVWGIDNDFQEPIIEGTWREVKNWFLNA